MRHPLLASYLWAAMHHPEFRRCQWQLRPLLQIQWGWIEWSQTLTLMARLQMPIVLNVDYRVLDAYYTVVLNNPDWDAIPF